MPMVTTMPIQSLFMGNLSDFSFTLEQNSATRMTESILHDFTMTTAGNEAAWIALLYVHMFMFTIRAQINEFFIGIFTGYWFSTWTWYCLIDHPKIAHTICGKMVKAMGELKVYFYPAELRYSCFNLIEGWDTSSRGRLQCRHNKCRWLGCNLRTLESWRGCPFQISCFRNIWLLTKLIINERKTREIKNA